MRIKSRTSKDQGTETENYWVKKFSGDLEKTGFPYDFKPVENKERKIDILDFRVPEPISSRLLEFWGGSDLKLYKILVSGLVALLGRYTYNIGGEAKDIFVGVSIAGMMPLRNHVHDTMSAKELFRQVSQNVDEALRYKDYSVEELMARLGKTASASDFSLFDVAILLENIHDREHIQAFSINVLISFSRSGTFIEGRVEYNASLYEKTSMERIAGHFTNLLRCVVDNTGMPLSEIDILSTEDRKRLLIDYNATKTDYPYEKTIHELFEEQVKRTPGHVAASFHGKELTYRDLDEKANQLANVLRQKGVKPDDLIGLMPWRSLEMMIGLLGILKAGACYIPIDPEYPSHRIQDVLSDSAAQIILLQPETMGKLEETGIDIEAIDITGRDLYQGDKTRPHNIAHPENLAYVIYTSGSTGKPKGVAVRHRNAVNFFKGMTDVIDFSSVKTILALTTISFDIFLLETLLPVTIGLKVVIADEYCQKDPAMIKDIIKETGVNLLQATPSRLKLLLSSGDNFDYFENIHYILVGGEQFTQKLFVELKTVYNGRIIDVYGPTETTVWSTSRDLTHLEEVNIGSPIVNTQVYIVDKFMNLLPPGVIGELYIGGDGLSRGYINKPELTHDVFIDNPFDKKEGLDKPYKKIYRTGDLARWLPDGNIECLGRIDFQVKIRGFRIETEEIENHILKQTEQQVNEAAVIAMEDSGGEHFLTAFLVSCEKIDTTALDNLLSGILPDYMVPSFFVQVEKMPMTPNGKVDRKALAKIEVDQNRMPYLHKSSLDEMAAIEKMRKKEQEIFEQKVLAGDQEIAKQMGSPAPGKFGCFLIGMSHFLSSCGDMILEHGHGIHGVISSDPQVTRWAEEKGLPFIKPQKTLTLAFLKLKSFDYLLSISNPYFIITEDMLALPKKCALNLHGAPLPRYAGNYPFSWAVINREKTHGVTWHVVDRGIDTGDIVAQAFMDLELEETGFTLIRKCFDASLDSLEEVLGFIEKNLKSPDTHPLPRRKQDPANRTYYQLHKRAEKGGIVSFDQDAQDIAAFSRGVNIGPYPNLIGKPRLAMGPSFFIPREMAVLDSVATNPPGTVTRITAGSITVSTATNDLKIREIFSINGTKISIPDFTEKFSLYQGYRFQEPDTKCWARIEKLDRDIAAGESYWVKKLGGLKPLILTCPMLEDSAAGDRTKRVREFPIPVEIELDEETLGMPRQELITTAFIAYLSLITGIRAFDVGYTDVLLREAVKGIEGLFADRVPLRLRKIDTQKSFLEFGGLMLKELSRVKKHKTYIRDVPVRYPDLYTKPEQEFSVGVSLVESLSRPDPDTGYTSSCTQLDLMIPGSGDRCKFLYNPALMAEKSIRELADCFSHFLTRVFTAPAQQLSQHERKSIDITGKIQRRIKLHDLVMDLDEVEDRINEHPDIREAVVVLSETKSGKHSLCAFIIPGKSVKESELREFLSQKLPPQALPGHFIQLDQMPVARDGKPDRAFLEVVELKTGTAYEAPRNETEEKLAGIWADVLNMKKSTIGIDDDFFKLGGHSLKGAVMIAAIHKELNVKVLLHEIFDRPTIRRLAEYIDTEKEETMDETVEKYAAIEKAAKKEYYVLSSLQKRFYILNFMEGESIVYNVPTLYLLGHEPDRQRLENAFKKLIRRHDSYRTSFHMVVNEPVQKIHDHVDFKLEYFNAPSASPEDVENVMRSFVTPFDLSVPPLMSAGVMKAGEGTYLLMFDIHHIISDGITFEVFKRELMALYEGEDLPPLKFQYKDYAGWMKIGNREEILKRQQKAYWLKEFAEEIPVLTLPYDFARPAAQSYEGNVKFFSLGKDQTNALKYLAKNENATLFMVLLAAYYIMLFKLSGHQDIVVGTPSGGRMHPDLENIVGVFVNTLALRNRIDGEATFSSYLKQLGERTLAAFENRQFPFEELVELLNVERDVSRNPLFDVMFTLQNMEKVDMGKYSLKLKPYKYRRTVSMFDMTIFAEESDEGLDFEFEYCTKLFNEETIERFINYFKNIISIILKTPGKGISQIEILPPAEKRKILYEFNDTIADYQKDKTIHEVFEAQVEKTPGNTAVIFEGKKLTYMEFNEKANQLAMILREKGVKPDNLVAIMVERSFEMMIGIFAIIKAGGAYLPIEPHTPEQRVDYMLKDSDCKVLLTQERFLDRVVFAGEVINLENDSLYTKKKQNPGIVNSSKDLAYIIYTSGSTGLPKGVMIEHQSVINRINWMQKCYPIGHDDVILQKTTFVFDVSVWELFWWSFQGSAQCLLIPGGEKDPAAIVDAIENNNITTMHFVPSMLNVFLAYLDGSNDFNEETSLKQVFASGEALTPHQVEQFNLLVHQRTKKAVLINLYGPTEATVDVSYYNCQTEGKPDVVPIGKSIDNIKLLIVDDKTCLRPIGVPGELCITGDGLARGYMNRPKLTAEKFINNPFAIVEGWGSTYKKLYRTGDLSRWIPDGNIEYLGRMDFQVKIRGFRIEIGEIENHILTQDEQDIKETVVLVRKDSGGEYYLCAYIVSGEKIDTAALGDTLSKTLSDYMIPSHFIQIEKIPLTPNGKVDRKALEKIDAGYSRIPYMHKKDLDEMARFQIQKRRGQDTFEEQIFEGDPGIISRMSDPAPGKFSCFIIGESLLAVKCAELVLRNGHKVFGMISNDSRVTDWARERDIPFINTRLEYIPAFLELKPFDYLFNIDSVLMIGEDILELPQKYAVNYHNSMLPKYVGTNAPNWAVMNLEKYHGITWHVMDRGLVTGDIIKQEKIELEPRETGISLKMKCREACTRTFEQVVEELGKGSFTLKKQDLGAQTYFGRYKRLESAGLLSFDREALEISAFVRGLNFGGYENPIGAPRLAMGKDFFVLPDIIVLDIGSQKPPGTVVRITPRSITLATASEDIKIRDILAVDGRKINIPEFVEQYKIQEGDRIEEIDRDRAARIAKVDSIICRSESFWVKRLAGLQPLVLTNTTTQDSLSGEHAIGRKLFFVPGSIKNFEKVFLPAHILVTGFAAYLSLLTGITSFDIGYTDPSLRTAVNGIEGIIADQVPIRIKIDPGKSFYESYAWIHDEIKRVKRNKTYLRDIRVRYPSLLFLPEQRISVGISLVKDLEHIVSDECKQLYLVVPADGNACVFLYNSVLIDEEKVIQLLLSFLDFLHQLFSNPSAVLSQHVHEDIGINGRIIEKVKISGSILDIGEAENCLRNHENIKEAAVVVNVSKSGKHSLCAFLVSDKAITEASLKEYLEKKYPGCKIPGHFIQLDEMPRTANGQINKKLLETVEIKAGNGYQAPRDEIEEKLAEIYHDILGIEKSRISISESFFRLGGHSLKAAILITKIHKELDVRLPMSKIFEMPTIKQLSGYIKQSTQGTEDKYASIPKAESKDYYPQTSAQKRLYFINQLEKDSILYNMPLMDIYHRGIEKEKLEYVFSRLIKRHESLRTSFHTIDGEAVQKIHDYGDVGFTIEYYETAEDGMIYSQQRGEEKTPIIGKHFNEVVEYFVRPFDLSKPPLIRAGLINIAGAIQILMLDIHHIVSDGVSLIILLEELWGIYDGKEFPPLTVQYKDFAEWTNKKEQKQRSKKHEAFWLDQFSGDISPLNLPTDYPRPAEITYDGDILYFEIGVERTRKLKIIAQEQGVSLFMILNAVFNVLLAKLSGQEEVIIGTVTAGRGHADLQKIIGMFVDTLALRNYPGGDKTFKEFLEEVKNRTLSAFEHQDYPFEELVSKVALRQDKSRNPLFDVVFTLENESDMTEYLQEVLMLDKSNPYKFNVRKSKFDMTLFALETEDGLRFSIEYNTNLFKEQTIERFANYFRKIASAVCQDTENRISEIEIITDEERITVLYEFNDTESLYPGHKTVHRLFEEQAAKTPDNIAVVGMSYTNQETRLTYSRLNEKANQLAVLLREKGIKQDSLVAVLVEPSQEMIIGLLGILKAGGAFLPIKDGTPEERIEYILEESGTGILLSCARLWAGITFAGETLNLDHADLFTGQGENPGHINTSGDMAYVIYTSGSTGKPKGVVVEHRSLVNLCFWHNNVYSVTSSARATKYAGFGFDASVWEIFPYLVVGASLYIVPDEIQLDIHALNDYFQANGITHGFLPTQICEQFMTLENTSLQVLMTGGDKLKTFTKRDYKLYNNYGPTENTVVATSFLVSELTANIPIGRPVFNNQIYILDAGNHMQPVGVPGELCIGGDSLARGYLNNPELTAEKFVKNPFVSPKSLIKSLRLYRTGDLCKRSADGNIEFLGRIDYQVKVRGYRIELGEIENQLLHVSSIKKALVIARDDGAGEKYLCAYIVPREDAVDITTVKKSLSKSLPDYMIPPLFVEIDEFPLNPNGKIDLRALPEPETDKLTEAFIPPQNETEKVLAKVWSEVLGIEKISIDDNFFDIGGDSIKTILISGKLPKHGLSISVNDFFKNPTIRQLAKMIKKVERVIHQGVFSGNVELTPIQKWYFEKAFKDKHHFNHVVMQYSSEGFDEEVIKAVFAKILEHHDALRMVYEFEKGIVTQRNRDLNEGELFGFELFDFKGKTDFSTELEREKLRINGSIDLKTGPLVRLALFRTDSGDYLMIVIHHVVVDGISWRILMEDLEAGYEQAKKGEKIKFQDKTDSFKDWAAMLKEYADSPKAIGELEYWKTIETSEVEKLRTDHKAEKETRTLGNQEIETLTLNRAETDQLLKEVNWPYNTEINDILLTALGMAMRDWQGMERILINLEGHGREDIIEDIDISRTVSWFTSQYPLLLDMKQIPDMVPGMVDEELSYQIRQVKETLRRVPNKGIGYGILKHLTTPGKMENFTFNQLHPEISFNYLGRLDEGTGALKKKFLLEIENGMSPGYDTGYAIDINGSAGREGLVFHIAYNKYEYDRSSILELSRIFKANLLKISRHCKEKKEEILRSGMNAVDFHINNEYERYLETIKREEWPELDSENEYRHILLTGATGFLGAHMVFELLNKTSANLYLPVRGVTQEAAEERFKKKMAFYFGDKFIDTFKNRLKVLKADLSEERLGIEKDDYEILCRDVEAIVHPAANVKHHGLYEELYKDNVIVTEKLLELALAVRKKDFHHISTLDVCSGDIPGKEYLLFTEYSHDEGQKTDHIYLKSKLEAEKRVLAYREKGINASIYRVGNLIFHSDSGIFQENIEDDYFYAIVRGAVKLEMVTGTMKDIIFDMSFINYTAAAAVLLLTKKHLKNETYHILNPNKLPMEEMLAFLGELKYTFNFVKETEVESYLDRFEGSRDYERIIELLKLHSWIFEKREGTQPAAKIDRTVALLKRLGFEWPKTEAGHIKKMIDYCKAVNFL